MEIDLDTVRLDTGGGGAEATVGSALVGFGSGCVIPPRLGIVADANVAYNVRELYLYDPIIPEAYFHAWYIQTGNQAGYPTLSVYCPYIKTAAMARLYGVGYVLEYPTMPGPTGSVLVGKIGDEILYRIPGASPATITPASSTGTPPDDAPEVPVHVSHPDPAAWSMEVRSTKPQVLRLRLTDVPGWHATIDGKALPLQPFAGVMLQARVPAGATASSSSIGRVRSRWAWCSPPARCSGPGCPGGGLVAPPAAGKAGRRRLGRRPQGPVIPVVDMGSGLGQYARGRAAHRLLKKGSRGTP